MTAELEERPGAAKVSGVAVSPAAGLPVEPLRPGDSLDLSGIDLRGAHLAGVVLRGSRLRGACLEAAVLADADLRLCDLSAANLRGANLTGAKLSRADLGFADLRGACLLTADLTEVVAVRADFREALLPMAVLRGAVLRAADFRWARLDGARLCNADLDGAQFSGASLVCADLCGAHLTPTTEFSYAFLQHACFSRTALTRAHLCAGIGEACVDLAAARATYLQLSQVFAAAARFEDADWARYQAWRMATESHRPRNAVIYYGPRARSGAVSSDRPAKQAFDADALGLSPGRGRKTRLTTHGGATGPTPPQTVRPPEPVSTRRPGFRLRRAMRRRLTRAAFFAWHGSLWCLGRLAEWLTGYGTSLRRLVAALVLLWSMFGFLYLCSGAIPGPEGLPADALEALHYSAATLTSLRPHPLTLGSGLIRVAAILEGVLGLVLLGALGAVAAGRLRQS